VAIEEAVKELQDTDEMPFGKHRGVLMQDVPAAYFHWLWSNGMRNEVKTSTVADYIYRNLDALKKEYPDGIWR
jgi:Putative quorum-sensing-regulated virulence factor